MAPPGGHLKYPRPRLAQGPERLAQGPERLAQGPERLAQGPERLAQGPERLVRVRSDSCGVRWAAYAGPPG
jgi:hypothetical protein